MHVLECKGPKGASVPKLIIEANASSLADPLLPDSRSGKKSEKHEAVNHDSWTRFEFRLSTVRQRPHDTRPRDGLLAWRKFRQVRGLDRCPATRRQLCCRSKEDSLRQQGHLWRC